MRVRLNKTTSIKILMVISLVFLVVAAPVSPWRVSAQTACATTNTPATTLGQVKQSVTVGTTGTYRVWSRIKVPNTTSNSYYLQIDGGCAINVGDSPGIAANIWTWVNYQNAAASSVIDVTLTAGVHTLTYTGKEADVQIDRVLLLSDTACVPADTGDKCAIVDAVNPTVNLTTPASNSSITAGSTVTITANAADNTGVAKVEFLSGTTVLSTDATTPYSYAWNTTGQAAGAKSLTAKAYDVSGNVSSSAAVTLNITAAPTPDITNPMITLTAPVSGSAVTVGAAIDMTANAADNIAVSKVEFLVDNAVKGTDTAAPYAYGWTTTGVAVGVHTLTAKAYDAAGNSVVSSPVTITLNSVPIPPVGDANNDGRVNGIDYSLLATHDGANFAPADFNGDGIVGAADLAILLSRWTW
jgi:hypothetical protein